MKLCFENGKHVLCEKPFTLNAAQAAEIQKLAADANKFCMEAMWTRFIPSIRKASELIKAGEIGEIRMIKGSFGTKLTKGSRFDLNQGGGALLDLGVYLVSLTHLFLGKPEQIQAEMLIGKTGVDEQAVMTLKYGNGAIASLSCSFQAELDNEFTIFGDKGSIRLGAPVYRPSTLYLSKSSGVAGAGGNEAAIRKNPYKFPLFLRFSPHFKGILITLTGRQSKKLVVPFEGNAYHYQIQEVNNCLRKSKQESDIMPLDHSIAVLHSMDEVRRKCGLKYPNE